MFKAVVAFSLAAVACIGACTPLDHVAGSSPAAIADKTTLDERIGITATNAYTAASLAGTALVRAGVIDRARFKAADQRGYEAVYALRAAYKVGNSESYTAAVTRAYLAAAEITSLFAKR